MIAIDPTFDSFSKSSLLTILLGKYGMTAKSQAGIACKNTLALHHMITVIHLLKVSDLTPLL